jgi:hypothetical protein
LHTKKHIPLELTISPQAVETGAAGATEVASSGVGAAITAEDMHRRQKNAEERGVCIFFNKEWNLNLNRRTTVGPQHSSCVYCTRCTKELRAQLRRDILPFPLGFVMLSCYTTASVTEAERGHGFVRQQYTLYPGKADITESGRCGLVRSLFRAEDRGVIKVGRDAVTISNELCRVWI